MRSCRPSSQEYQTTHALYIDTDLLLQESHTKKTFQTSSAASWWPCFVPDLENIVLRGAVNAQVKHCISGHLEAVLWKARQVPFKRKPCTQTPASRTLYTMSSLAGIVNGDQGSQMLSWQVPKYKLENQVIDFILALWGSEVRQQVAEAHPKTRQFLNIATERCKFARPETAGLSQVKTLNSANWNLKRITLMQVALQNVCCWLTNRGHGI